MGNFLKTIERAQQVQIDHFFTSHSLTKLRQFYGLFKSISQTYSIDNQQFCQLFGKHEDIFQLFDTDNNLLIDGLELFSGLILLSTNIKYEDKIVFLFQLFDFNDLKSLSKTDIEFMLISSCSAVSKTYLLKNLQDDGFIQEFVRDQFPSDQRVNISQMLKWTRNCTVVSQFFQSIHQQWEKQQQGLLSQKIYITLLKPKQQTTVPSSHHYSKQEQFMLQTQKIFKSSEQQNEIDVKNNDINPYPSWVYGIRHRDVKQFVKYITLQSQELLLYFISKVAVIYNIKSKSQTHYLGHRNQIISLTVKEDLCATGEYARDPQVRIWNIQNLQTIQVIRGYHIRGVHLLQFLNNGLLVTCGSSEESPIILFDIENGEPVFSTYSNFPAVEISSLQNFINKKSEQFIVGSLYEVYHFQCSETQGKLSMSISKFNSSIKQSKITTCCFFMINSTFRHLRQYDEKIQKQILTGHENGVINIWNLQRREKDFTFSQEGSEIVRLIPTNTHLLVVTDSSFLTYYGIDVQEKVKLKTIDITQTELHLQSYDVSEVNLHGKEKKMIIFTKKADIFIFYEQQSSEAPTLSHFNNIRYKTKRVQHILSLEGEIKQQKIIKKDGNNSLYFTISHSIKAIDVINHRFMREWNIGQEIICFDVTHTKSYGLFIVAATVENKLYIFSNKAESPNKTNIEGQIISVHIHTEDSPAIIIVLVSTKEGIIKYNVIKNILSNPNFIARPNLSPQITSLQGNVIALSDQNNQLSALIIKQMHIQKLFTCTSSQLLKLFYHIPLANKKLVLPVIVGNRTKALVAGRQDGKIFIWNNYEELNNHNFVMLDAHIFSVADVSYSHDQKYLFSCGKNDGMIISWRMRYYNEQGSAVIGKLRDEQVYDGLIDDFSGRRVEFCKFKNDKLIRNYDQHINVKGIKNDVIRRLFKSNLNDWRISNKVVRNQQPHLHLKMSFVFGIETYNQNNTVIALKNPKRFLYFVSKIIVIYYPAENDQQFYRGHRFKVTSMVLLEDGIRVASAQASFRPSIHIWSTKNLETERIIHTYHRWGIIQLVTHRNIILSYGLKQVKYEQQSSNGLIQEGGYERSLYSYQVTDYEKGLVIATRQQKNMIHSMAINPLNPLHFATCSEGKVTFWEVSFHSIIKKKVCWLKDDAPTCCTYFNPKKGEPDLLVGTISGALGIITRRQHWNVFKKGEKESKRINCILLIKRAEQILIMVASQDNMIKIYNQKLEYKFKESMLKIQPIQQGSKKVRESKGDRQDRNCSVQSLSLINDPQGRTSDNKEKQQLRILLGTRNGQVLELVESKQGRYGSSKSLFFKAILYLRFNSSQDVKRLRNKVLLTHHPKQQIIATIGLDQQIIFWDTQHNKLLHVTQLNIQNSEKKYPTAIKFSHNGDHLIVGFSDGQLMFLESKMAKSIQSKIDEKLCPLNLGKAKKEKDEDGQAVLNIEISQNGERIAVSYQKIDSQKSYSHIKISHFKIKDKAKNNKSQYDKILDNTSPLPCPHLQRSFHTQSGLLFGFAAYSLSFAAIQNTSKQYFLSYYQMIDENQSRLSINIEKGEERNYNIWQVSDSIYPVTSPLVETIKWKKFYIHNAIQTNYMFHQTDLSLTPKQQSPPSNNNLDLLQFTNMTIFDQCIITTSFNGDLHIFKLGTLEGEGEGMIGKTIPGHCCKINQIQLFYNQFKSNIYTSGENDQCIIKWSVEKFDTLMENQDYQQDQKDLFGEVPDRLQLADRIKLYKSKCQVQRAYMRNEDFIEWFRVKHIFGRRADQGRNNLKYDKYERIIYSSGHSIVTLDPPTGYKQFIYIKNDPSHYLQEITALQISKDGQYLVSCHSGLRAGVILWELNSKILLKRFYLKEVVHILYVSLSEDNQRLIIYGITADSVGQLVMIDLFNEQIMAVVTYTHKQAWQIKNICFRSSSHDKFVTCGIESIKQWQLISNQLINVSSIEQEDSIIGTCVDFIQGNVVVANDRGELMIWTQSGEIVRRQQHQNMITCLSVSEQSIIVTGSISTEENLSQIIIWAFQSNELIVIDKISIRNDPSPSLIVSSRVQNRRYKESDVQSLHISRNRNGVCKVLIGVTKGDIYEYGFDPTIKNEKSQIKSSAIKENQPVLISSFDDGQRIRAMFFTSNESQLFEISQNGLLRVWSVQKAQLEWSHAFQCSTIGMVYSIKHELIIIAFKECVRFFLNVQHQRKLIQIQQNYKLLRYITHLVLSSNEKMIALGIQRNSDKANIIQLYQVNLKQFKMKLHFEVDSAILFIDFNRLSSEKAFMLASTKNGLQLFDLNIPQNINSQLSEGIDWIGSGLIFSNKVRRTKVNHQERFKDGLIVNILEMGSDLILFDYYAGIYMYRNSNMIANCHLNISSIDSVALSSSQRLLAVGSKIDRNIVLLQLPFDNPQ